MTVWTQEKPGLQTLILKEDKDPSFLRIATIIPINLMWDSMQD